MRCLSRGNLSDSRAPECWPRALFSGTSPSPSKRSARSPSRLPVVAAIAKQRTFSGSGIYRYIVPEDEVQSSVVLTQLRLKHVADSDSHRAGLVVESLRRDGYLAYLRSMGGA